MSIQIKLRRDTYANWTSVNPVLAEGEIGLVTNFADNNTRIKIGDGVTAWEDLDYFTTSQGLSNYVTDAELASALSNYVPTSRTVNGKALSSNISIDKTDVGLGSVDNTSDANKPISTATQTALDLKQDKAIVVSSNQTAVNDAVYHNVATATYTDPSPVEGKGFTVFVRNGTATVGGTAYATAGTIIKRTFHSGGWANYVFTIDSVGVITPVNTPITNNITVNELANRTQGQIDNLVPQSRTLTINGTAYDLSSNRSWTVGDVTTGSAASLASLAITGTAGAGFLSLINQSSAPSAVNGTTRIYSDSSTHLSFVRRNAANSADITRTLAFPDSTQSYTFPTPASGNASTLAGLGTANTFTQTNTFSALQKIASLQILDPSLGYVDVLSSSSTTALTFASGFSSVTTTSAMTVTGSLTGKADIVANTFRNRSEGTRLTITTLGRTGANTDDVYLVSGNNVVSGAFVSGSILLDVGTSTGGTRGGVALFNGNVAPTWNSLQRGMFVGNATAAAAGNPTNGGYLFVDSGRFKIRETDTGSNNFIVHAAASTKTTAGAPYTNDGYVTVIINGTSVKLMTTA